jgi:hypothetical protein
VGGHGDGYRRAADRAKYVAAIGVQFVKYLVHRLDDDRA